MRKYKIFFSLIAFILTTTVILNKYLLTQCIKNLKCKINDKNKSNEVIALFGIIADIQYADLNDQIIYGRKRYYRSGIDSVKRAVADWKQIEFEFNLKFKFVLQLGDLLDIRGNKQDYEKNVLKILNHLNSLFPNNDLNNSKQLLHLIGNHEKAAFVHENISSFHSKYYMNSARIFNTLNNNLANYYTFDITSRLRMICLDLYEISLYNISSNEFIEKYRKLTDKKLLHYNAYNGAISQRQFKWLNKQLIKSQKQNKKVIISGHIPLLTEVGDINIAWNAEQILKLIHSFDNNLVIAYISGHYHKGGHFLDNKYNIHHLTLSAILEAGSNSNYHRHVTGFVYENRFILKSSNQNHSFTVYL
jgi:hypothetical protein